MRAGSTFFSPTAPFYASVPRLAGCGAPWEQRKIWPDFLFGPTAPQPPSLVQSCGPNRFNYEIYSNEIYKKKITKYYGLIYLNLFLKKLFFNENLIFHYKFTTPFYSFQIRVER